MGRGRIANKIFLFNSADVPEVSRPKFQDLISKILNGVSAGLCYILHMFVFSCCWWFSLQMKLQIYLWDLCSTICFMFSHNASGFSVH